MDELTNFRADSDRDLFIDLDSIGLHFSYSDTPMFQTFILTERKEYEFPDEWKECYEFSKQKSIVIT